MPARRTERWWESWTLERVSSLPNFVASIRVSRKGPTKICLIMKSLPALILRSMAGVTEKAEDLKCTESRWSSSSLTRHSPFSLSSRYSVESRPPAARYVAWACLSFSMNRWLDNGTDPGVGLPGRRPHPALLCSGPAVHLVLSAYGFSVFCPDLTLQRPSRGSSIVVLAILFNTVGTG